MSPSPALFLVPDLLGPPNGIARYCAQVCAALSGVGVRLFVVSLHDTPGLAGHLAEVVGSSNIHYEACSGSRRKFATKAVAAALRSRPRLLLVGHAHFSPLGWLLARLTRAPLVIFIYGIEVWQALSSPRRRSLRRADRIISISRFTARKGIAANGLPARRLRILHNCLPARLTGLAGPGDRLVDSGSRQLSMLTVARMSLAEQYKGHDYVIRAMPVLLQRFPALRYHIVGDGDGRPKLEELARQEQVAHAVRFHGNISDAQLAACYRSASLFIMPSRAEGFGFVFLEAMAAGLPVIAGNLDASSEVVQHEETGFVVDPTSVDEIVESVSKLLEDGELRERMGQAAKARVQSEFSFSAFQARLSNILSGLQPPRRNPA